MAISSKNPYIKSPISYIGGKYKLLPQILPLFPQRDFRIFWEGFSGGCNLAQNVNAQSYICCDILKPLQDMLTKIKNSDIEYFIKCVDGIVNHYNLSKTNAEGFMKLRSLYNYYDTLSQQNNLIPKEIIFYTLICYSFNNQIRFNNKGDYNMPFGKNRSSFNPTLRSNLIRWHDSLKDKNIIFSTRDFRYTFEHILSKGSTKDFCYFDPPYLAGSVATYNEQGGWKEQDEKDLLSCLTEINKKHIPFALSNVLSHKGEDNQLLIDWSKDYNIHYINQSYANCNYHKNMNDKKEVTVEVLITNY